MAIQSEIKAVTSSEPVILGGTVSTDPTAAWHGFMRIIVRPPSAGTAYLGGTSSITSSGGWPVTSADLPREFVISHSETLWGCGSTAMSLGLLRMGETT